MVKIKLKTNDQNTVTSYKLTLHFQEMDWNR